MLRRALTEYLTRPRPRARSISRNERTYLHSARPGDVILVDGTSRISVAIKYLTQSTWSHAALVASEDTLIEASLKFGVIEESLGKYREDNVRICRPVGLNVDDIDALVNSVRRQVGVEYDVKNVVDLARYLLPTPPVPQRFRRRMLTLGSGDPTRKVICSSLIARAFQKIGYPILPERWSRTGSAEERRIVAIARHHSLFVPRDFDLSPYFEIVKPTLDEFDPRSIELVPSE